MDGAAGGMGQPGTWAEVPHAEYTWISDKYSTSTLGARSAGLLEAPVPPIAGPGSLSALG